MLNSVLETSPTVTELVTSVTSVGAVPVYAENGIATGLAIILDAWALGT